MKNTIISAAILIAIELAVFTIMMTCGDILMMMLCGASMIAIAAVTLIVRTVKYRYDNMM